MPRPTRAQGRPGTQVVPTDWQQSHAPVVDKTRTGRCAIHAPAAGEPVFDPEFGYSVVPDAQLIHSGTVRVQSLSAADRRTLVGEQDQSTAAYLVVIDLNAPPIPAGSVVTFTESTDDWLNARQLFVRAADLGTLRFERDLYCVEDITDATPADQGGDDG